MSARCSLGRTLLLSFSIFSSPLARAADTVVLDVTLNGEDKGDHFLLRTAEGDLLFPYEEWKTIGFRAAPAGDLIDGKRYVSLLSLAPGIRFQIDDKEALLRLTADPTLLQSNVIDLAYRGPPNVIYTKDNAAFLNYSLGYRTEGDSGPGSVRLPWEVGISNHGILGFSSFSYSEASGDKRLVRSTTSLTRDDPETGIRFVAGDFSASSGPLGTTALFGGLSLSKNFSMMPFFIAYPGLNISGVLETPSDVSVYVNDVLVKSERLSPGEFSFSNLPTATGFGETTLVIRDAFGRERRSVVPFNLSQRLLKPGLHDYSYNFGFKREASGQGSFAYGELSLVAFHRIGLTPELTGGLRVEADKERINLGPTATVLLGRAGEANIAVAVSRDGGRLGSAGLLSYFHSHRFISTSVSLIGFSREYASLSLMAEQQEEPRFEGTIGFSYQHQALGWLSVAFSRSSQYGRADKRRVSLSYNRQLPKSLYLHVTATRKQEESNSHELFVGLSFVPGRNTAGSLSYQKRDDGSTETVTLQQNPPLGTGVSYRLLADQGAPGQGSQEPAEDLSVQYKGPYGVYSADYRRNAGLGDYDVSLSGGIAMIDRSFYLTRPIADSFALVRVGDVDDVGVLYSNERVGVTHRKGELLVPNLVSYYPNQLSFDAQQIPINYQIPEIRKYVSTPYRGGGVVQFDLTKLQGFEGRLFLAVQGERGPAEYATLDIDVRGKTIEAIVGKGGEFYLENIPPGRFPAKLAAKDRECRFEIVIPESDEMMVDLGEITCDAR